MNPTIRSLITSLLAVAGASLVTKGLVSQAGLETIIGALVTIIGVVWDAIANRRISQNVAKLQEALPAHVKVDGVIGNQTVNAILNRVTGNKGSARIGALVIVAVLALGSLFFLTACTTPAVTVPLISQDRYGSISAYGVISYIPPKPEADTWTPDSETLGDK